MMKLIVAALAVSGVLGGVSFEELRSTTDSRSAPKSAEVPLSFGGAESRPVLAFAQQVPVPARPHVEDNASIGNKKPSKREKNPTSRTVSGQVTDETGQVLAGAMVTLTNKKTNERTTFFTKKDGRYQFEDLSFTNDYEVQARYKTFASDPRKLSQFDTAPRPTRILEINTAPRPAVEAENKKP